jgi:hypothetical protein
MPHSTSTVESSYLRDRKETDIESKLLELVSATPVMQREMAHAINDPSNLEALNSLAWIVSAVSKIAGDLNDLDPTAGIISLAKASRLMGQQMGRVLNESEDMESWDSLEVIVSVVAKIAMDLDAENGTAPKLHLVA